MTQLPDFGLSAPEIWEIMTHVNGLPFWGLRPYYRGEHLEGDPNKSGIIITSSLPMALRLAQAGHQGNQKAYEHALMYMIESVR